MCGECHLRRDACLCGQRPNLASEARFHLLVHPRELCRPTNTGHLITASLASADYHVWSRRPPPQSLLAALSAPQRETWLVFPSPDAPRSLAGAGCRNPQQFVILDGTWQETRKMLRQSPYLTQLPRLSLPAGAASRYTLRRHQPAGHLATVEVAVTLLQMLGEVRQAQALDGYYRAFVRHFSASRSGHGVSA